MFYQGQHFGISEYLCKEEGENFSFGAHMHRSFEFIMVCEGEMTVTVAERVYVLHEGEGVLIFPEQIHSLKSTKSRHLLVIFSPDLVSAYNSLHSFEIPRESKILVPHFLQNQLHALCEASSILQMKGTLYSLCATIDEHTEYEKKTVAKADLLHAIFAFVEGHYDAECSLSDLSAALGYNSAYLSRYFSEATGTSFLSYLHQYKVSRACYLLRNTDKTVLECAYESGYSSLRSFNRCFKSITGFTPKQYRYKQ